MISKDFLADTFIYQLRYDFGEFEGHAKLAVKNYLRLSDKHSDNIRKEELDSESVWLLGMFLQRAKEICDQEGIAAKSDEAYETFDAAYELSDDLRYIMNNHSKYENKLELSFTDINKMCALRLPLNGWQQVFEQLKTEDIPGRISNDLEAYISRYLETPLRSEVVDAFMFKILAEEEPIQYIHEVSWENPTYPALKMKAKLTEAQEFVGAISKPPLANLAKNIMEAVVLPILIIAAAVWYDNRYMIYGTFALSMGWISYSLYNMRTYLKYRSSFLKGDIKNRHTETLKLVLAMDDFIRFLRTSGKLSLARIEEKLKSLEEIGAVMPETLFVFIEDLKSNGRSSI